MKVVKEVKELKRETEESQRERILVFCAIVTVTNTKENEK